MTSVDENNGAQGAFRAIKAQAQKIFGQIDEDAREAGTESYVAESEAYFAQKINKLALKNQRRKDDNELRKQYAKNAYFLACCSVFVWISLFGAVAISNSLAGRALLSDQGLATLTAGATVNVLAAFLAIVRGLFPFRRNSRS